MHDLLACTLGLPGAWPAWVHRRTGERRHIGATDTASAEPARPPIPPGYFCGWDGVYMRVGDHAVAQPTQADGGWGAPAFGTVTAVDFSAECAWVLFAGLGEQCVPWARMHMSREHLIEV